MGSVSLSVFLNRGVDHLNGSRLAFHTYWPIARRAVLGLTIILTILVISNHRALRHNSQKIFKWSYNHRLVPFVMWCYIYQLRWRYCCRFADLAMTISFAGCLYGTCSRLMLFRSFGGDDSIKIRVGILKINTTSIYIICQHKTLAGNTKAFITCRKIRVMGMGHIYLLLEKRKKQI